MIPFQYTSLHGERQWLCDNHVTMGRASNGVDEQKGAGCVQAVRQLYESIVSFVHRSRSSHRRFANNGLDCSKHRGNQVLVSRLYDMIVSLQGCCPNPVQ